jgi:release factor glutamine methyltransferase
VNIHERIADARRQLRDAGIPPDEADLDARLLAERVLGWDTATLLAAGRAPGPPGFAAAYAALLARRLRREPLAYITGEREFWNRVLLVSPAVLVPRPETEIIVDAALEALRERGVAAPVRIADIGTGGGCLAVTLACECRSAQVVASDCSDAALEVARRNAVRHGVSARISFEQADLLAPGEGPFDLVVSNPPYIADAERPTLPPEVRDFEPGVALFAGEDGLQVIRRLVALAPGWLVPGGSLIFEIGAGQADAVRALISDAPGLTMVALKPDLQGIPRTVVARRALGTRHQHMGPRHSTPRTP